MRALLDVNVLVALLDQDQRSFLRKLKLVLKS